MCRMLWIVFECCLGCMGVVFDMIFLELRCV